MPTAGAQLFGQLVHLRRPLLARADVDDLGAEQRVEQRVRRRRGRRLAVGHEHRAHPQLRRGGGRRARMIRLHPSGRDERIGAFRLRARGDERELPHLVPTEAERDRIVSLHEQTWTAPEHGRQSRQRLDER